MNLNALIMFHALNGEGDVLVASPTEQVAEISAQQFEAHLLKFSLHVEKLRRNYRLPNDRRINFVVAHSRMGLSVEHYNHVIVVDPGLMKADLRDQLRFVVGNKGAKTYVEYSE